MSIDEIVFNHTRARRLRRKAGFETPGSLARKLTGVEEPKAPTLKVTPREYHMLLLINGFESTGWKDKTPKNPLEDRDAVKYLGFLKERGYNPYNLP